MTAIGGYFGLELRMANAYHSKCKNLNTGRNALEYILRVREYKRIFLPYYTCEVLVETVKKLDIKYEFYSINEYFELPDDACRIKKDEALLYINYFGLKDNYINSLKRKFPNLIIDNAQAFYAMPLSDVDTFYSPRKFFGVPDGAYLYINKDLKLLFEKDYSFTRFEHLLRRIDDNAENGYLSFIKNEETLNDVPLREMSDITKALLRSIDYESISQQRRKNFIYLDKELSVINKVKFDLKENEVPLVYPFYSTDPGLRSFLQGNGIYAAAYWPYIVQRVKTSSIEFDYINNLVHLPIDQRVSKNELDIIIKKIKDEYKR